MRSNKTLTKKQLEDWGFVEVKSTNGYDWEVMREWKGTGTNKTKRLKKIAISTLVAKHKYGKDKYYRGIGFSAEGRTHTISLARFIYAWFKGDVPPDMEIDHIDNDPFNNDPDNLRLTTKADNIRKRFIDGNFNGNVNQYGNRVAVECDLSTPRYYYTDMVDTLDKMISLESDPEKLIKLKALAKSARGMVVYWDANNGQKAD